MLTTLVLVVACAWLPSSCNAFRDRHFDSLVEFKDKGLDATAAHKSWGWGWGKKSADKNDGATAPAKEGASPVSIRDEMVFDMKECAEGIHVFTDMEGDYDSFMKAWIDGLHSKGALTVEEVVQNIQFGNVTVPVTYSSLRLADGHCVANLGDMLDQGFQGARQGVFRGVATFNALKRTYPSRVQLILGNRDINKLRLTSELSESSGFQGIPGPFAYHTSPGPIGNDELPTKACSETEKCPRPKDSELDKLTGNKKTKWFKWILSQTMGAGSAFQGYQTELKILTKNDVFEDENMVTEFILEQLRPDGLFYEYLKMSGLVAHGGSALFLHGNLPDDILSSDGFFLVPTGSEGIGVALDMSMRPNQRQRIDTFSGTASTPSDFVRRLWAWKDRVFREWDSQREMSSSVECKTKLCRGGNALIDMALGAPEPTARNGGFSKSIISTPATGAYKKEFAEKLLNMGIKYVFTGHIPQGAVPQSFVETETGVTIVNSDLTYAHPVPNCKAGSAGNQHCVTDVSVLVTFHQSATSNVQVVGQIRAANPTDAQVLTYGNPLAPSSKEVGTCSHWAGPGQLSDDSSTAAARANPTMYKILQGSHSSDQGIVWDSKPYKFAHEYLKSSTGTTGTGPLFAGIYLDVCHEALDQADIHGK